MFQTKLNIAVAVLFAALISSCQNEKSKENTEERIEEILDLAARDTSVNPADDFFAYANGTWMKNSEIPASKTGWGSFYIVRDQALENMHHILDSCANITDSPKGSATQMIGDLYASLMDTVSIEKAGIDPLRPVLDRIASVKSKEDLMSEVVKEYIAGDRTMFSAYVSPDDKNSEVQRFNLNQGGLGLPNRDYYFKKDGESAATREKYKAYIAKLFALSGVDEKEAKSKTGKILALETKMAEASKSPVDLRNPQANYNLMSTAAFQKLSPNMNWETNLAKLGVDVDTVLVGQPEFYKNLSQLIVSEPIDTWKDYLAFHYIKGYASLLSQPFADAQFDFYSRHLGGQKEPEVRWKRASGIVDSQLGDALGAIYVKEYFPPSAKTYMVKLVDNLQDTYRERIQALSWMGDSTKTKAVEKLDAFTKKIGYPDTWKDYSGVEVSRDSAIANMQNIGAWHYKENIEKLGKPVDKTEWGMSAPTVNAYYNPSFNEIVFPAGILQPPFFYPNGDDALNYGAIGAAIGHEMTHGFDDQGSQYDLNGNLNNWWTEADRENFTELTNRVVEQYANYQVLDSVSLNGELTQGENIADNGGLAIAYAAFKKTDQGKGAEKINGLTPDQRFFLAFAAVWRMKNTDERMLLRVNTDPHSPELYRVNGTLSNMPEFYDAFGVTADSKLYRPDSIRTTIW
ncbi:M13 family metallopeptidase [Cryomorpha ignava]|uniref:M13 family metallopeptidase n=1 Tax=Cryomorpha ignava TaxID=101383 RepID=A0A7K3WLJ9_9FLAO|nr:M13 family metallopeptidase [Cryomorpha ignava]NEN22517.1 M13 family metallopeptidase [Cryomorpha ignava]